MAKGVTDILIHLDSILRHRYDHLGFIAQENGAYQTGHVPHIAPQAYLCRRFAGLDKNQLAEAENECGRTIFESYREFLCHMNGAHILGVSFHGADFGSVDRSDIPIWKPVSLRYQNVVERPTYVPAGHLGIGTINGEWSAQGHLYLTSRGEVELHNAKFDIIGARWTSLAEFLEVEIPRRFSLFDNDGHEIKKSQRLPGNTSNWEQLAQEAKQERTRYGLFKPIRKLFRIE